MTETKVYILRDGASTVVSLCMEVLPVLLEAIVCASAYVDVCPHRLVASASASRDDTHVPSLSLGLGRHFGKRLRDCGFVAWFVVVVG